MSEQDQSSEKHGPIWDHDELSMASWLEDRLRWAVKKEPNYASLACEGYILDRSKLLVPTNFHGIAIREGSPAPSRRQPPFLSKMGVIRIISY